MYHIRPEASWSDGTPISSSDFIFTHEVIVDPANNAPDTSGYELVTGHEIIDTKTVMFFFSEPYGPWQTLFSLVLPSHVLDDEPYSDGFARTLTTSSGPFAFVERTAGEDLILRRSLAYWSASEPISGGALGDVLEIRFVFDPSVRDQLRDLERGDIDMSRPRPLAWMVEEVQTMDEATFQVAPGAFWEHVDFNHADPLLSQLWVRQAIASGIDRQAMLDMTIRGIDPTAEPLNSTVQMMNSANYEGHFDAEYDPEAAEQILLEHFCELQSDDIYSCQGRRMSFVWATTVGDPFREAQFELAAASLAEIGIEVIADFMTPSQMFSGDVLFGGPEVWQMINFSWKADADPHLANSTYHCTGAAPSGFGDLNVNRFCDVDVDNLIRSTDSTVDQEQRLAAYQEADAQYLGDLAIIPLYQKPAFMAWNSSIEGPELNPSSSTDFWNVGAWSGKGSVVVALNAEPGPINPIRPADANEALILASLFHGAFGIDPAMRFVPVLVEEVEIITSGS